MGQVPMSRLPLLSLEPETGDVTKMELGIESAEPESTENHVAVSGQSSLLLDQAAAMWKHRDDTSPEIDLERNAFAPSSLLAKTLLKHTLDYQTAVLPLALPDLAQAPAEVERALEAYDSAFTAYESQPDKRHARLYYAALAELIEITWENENDFGRQRLAQIREHPKILQLISSAAPSWVALAATGRPRGLRSQVK